MTMRHDPALTAPAMEHLDLHDGNETFVITALLTGHSSCSCSRSRPRHGPRVLVHVRARARRGFPCALSPLSERACRRWRLSLLNTRALRRLAELLDDLEGPIVAAVKMGRFYRSETGGSDS